MKILPYLLLLGALAYFLPKSCADEARWEAWRADTTRLLRDVDGMRSQKLILERENDSLRSVAERGMTLANRQHRSVLQLQGTADSLLALLDSATDAPDSLLLTARALGTTQAALGEALSENASLRASYAAQSLVAQRLKVSEAQAWGAVDSLSALIRRVPGCQKIPVLGIPVPKVGLGVGVGSKGLGPFVGIVVPLGKC